MGAQNKRGLSVRVCPALMDEVGARAGHITQGYYPVGTAGVGGGELRNFSPLSRGSECTTQSRHESDYILIWLQVIHVLV